MSSLLFLFEDDFYVSQGKSGNVLCCNIKSTYSMVLFYSTTCVHCQTLVPIFKRLATSITGCQFAITNISQQRNVIKLSEQTIMPIKYVPYMVFYNRGRPFMKYSGPNDANEILKFIKGATGNLQTRKFHEEPNTKHKQDYEEPEYWTNGVPKTCDDEGVCYLEFDDAYHKNKPTN